MSKGFLIVVILFSISCKSQSLTLCGEPMENFNWLSALLEGREKAVVFSFKHNDDVIVEYHHCYQCPDAMVIFYKCDGKKVCEQGGFLGTNTCPEFDVVDKQRIYPKK